MRPHAGRSLEFAGRLQTRSAVRPPARARPRCSVDSRRNGAGGQSGARRASPPKSRIWFADPFRYAGTNSASYFDVEVREVPVEGDRLLMGPERRIEAMRREHDHGRPHARRDHLLPIRAGAGDCAGTRQVREETPGLDIPIHVDAASGGFLAPFCQPEIVWDFRLPRVKSINTSGHKFGLAPLGVGWVVWRDHADLPEELIFHVNYLGGDMPTFALNFSRPAGQIVCQYYNFLRLGFEGYRKIQNACYHTAQHLAAEIDKMGPFRVIHDGRGGMPAVCWTLTEGAGHGFTLYDVSDRLRARGWQVPAYSMPAEARGSRRPANPRSPRRQPRPRRPAARGHPPFDCDPRKASRLTSAHRERGRRLQSQLELICLDGLLRRWSKAGQRRRDCVFVKASGPREGAHRTAVT